jgi:4-hydroxy-2-oxoheptanedioate aldolase
MVETVTAVENIDAIAAVDGVDVVYIGPSDLASSAGLPPQLALTNPDHRALVERIAMACKKAGRWSGMHTPSADVSWYIEQGFRMFPIHRDLPAYQEGLAHALAQARASFPQ